MATSRMSFSYPDDMKKELQKLAKSDARTLSSYIQMILNDHIEKKKSEAPKPKKKRRRKN